MVEAFSVLGFYNLFDTNYETIDAHGDRAGYHPKLAMQHSGRVLEQEGVSSYDE